MRGNYKVRHLKGGAGWIVALDVQVVNLTAVKSKIASVLTCRSHGDSELTVDDQAAPHSGPGERDKIGPVAMKSVVEPIGSCGEVDDAAARGDGRIDCFLNCGAVVDFALAGGSVGGDAEGCCRSGCLRGGRGNERCEEKGEERPQFSALNHSALHLCGLGGV